MDQDGSVEGNINSALSADKKLNGGIKYDKKSSNGKDRPGDKTNGNPGSAAVAGGGLYLGRALRMKRLTEEIRNYDGTGISKRPIYVPEYVRVPLTDHMVSILTKLADYEDTGITPKEVEELKERDTEKAAIITGYNRAVGCKVGECPK